MSKDDDNMSDEDFGTIANQLVACKYENQNPTPIFDQKSISEAIKKALEKTVSGQN